MKIGLYFGSFNPIHQGHLIIAQHMLNFAGLNEVWFVVSPQNPFKNESSLLEASHRLFLVRAAIDAVPGFKASNVEFSLPKPSYTIHTLTYLKEQYPNHQFSIIMGSDGFQNIDKWKNGDFIIKQYPILVYERPGFPFINKNGLDVSRVNAPFLDISSTMIRKMIKEKKSIRFLVPNAVMELIESNLFYR